MTSGIIGAIVAVLLLFGGGVGGWFLRGEVAPKTVNHITTVDQQVEVTAHNTQRTDVMQGQILVHIEGETTNRAVYVQVANLTNVTVTSSSQTNNVVSVTNAGKND